MSCAPYGSGFAHNSMKKTIVSSVLTNPSHGVALKKLFLKIQCRPYFFIRTHLPDKRKIRENRMRSRRCNLGMRGKATACWREGPSLETLPFPPRKPEDVPGGMALNFPRKEGRLNAYAACAGLAFFGWPVCGCA